MACKNEKYMSTYIKRLSVVDSTNRYVRDNADTLWKEAGGSGCVAVIAKQQTAGRGQRGNSWQSQGGQNLLLTLLLRPGSSLEVARQFLLSQSVALAVHSAMKCYGIETSLKWPNDIYAGGKKLAGILVELDYSGAFVEQAIVGIGLNVNQTEFAPMDRVPVSMKMLLGKEVPVDSVLDDFLCCFSHYRSRLLYGCREALSAEYSGLLLGLGEERTYIDSNGPFPAVMEGVEPTGHLLLRRNDGTLSRYMFKEVEQPM